MIPDPTLSVLSSILIRRRLHCRGIRIPKRFSIHDDDTGRNYHEIVPVLHVVWATGEKRLSIGWDSLIVFFPR